jgi:hypothetical protein
MAEFRRASDERVNVFEVDGLYLFKHYFDSETVFDRLKRYYNNQQYRFEVPPAEFVELQSFLERHGYGLVLVDELAVFVVVVRQYTSHPDNIFKASVVQRSVDGYNCFLLKDHSAVERAVEDGATRLEDADVPNPFE